MKNTASSLFLQSTTFVLDLSWCDLLCYRTIRICRAMFVPWGFSLFHKIRFNSI